MAKPDPRASFAATAALLNEAAAHYRARDLAAAERTCARVLKAQPKHPDALHLGGLIKLDAGKPAAALPLLEAAAKLLPNPAQVLCSLARTLMMLDRKIDALAAADRAQALSPDSFEVCNARGNVLLDLERCAEALAMFERVVALEPRFLLGRASIGNALARLGRADDAIAHYDAVLAAQPQHAETHLNRASALATLGRNADALTAYERALSLRPGYARALLGRGVALQALNRHEDAIEAFEAVLKVDRDNADARHNQAISRLTLGDYRGGFAQYEARWQRTGMSKRPSVRKPLWLGEYPLARKTILIHAEQGLGDTIQFVRYAALLAAQGAGVVVETQPPLRSLLARAPGVTQAVARGDALPAFDVHCPIASLPLACGTELSSILAAVPYLTAAPDRIEVWRERIARQPAPRVAVAWAGQAAHPNDRNRSIPLETFAALFDVLPSVVGIQHDRRDGEAELLAQWPNVVDVATDLNDFEDTAAVLSLCDLVIAVDTAVAHLAGALGKPVWLLLPYQPDWRWLLGRADSPWYPSARLFRQPSPGDWDPVLAAVKDALATR